VAYYFDRLADAGWNTLDTLGMGADYVARTGCACVTEQVYVRYMKELRAGDPVHVCTGLLHLGNASLRIHHRLSHGRSGQLIASLDQYGVHLDTDARRPVPLPSTLRQQAQRLVVPTQAGLQASSSVIAT